MLTRIVLENFKGISDPVEIPIRPITMLFGANSAGKSTVLHALLYAYEILERRKLDADQVGGTDHRLDLGGFRSLVHRHDLTREIRMRFEFEVPESRLPWPADPGGVLADSVSSGVIAEEYQEFESCLRVRAASVELTVAWDSHLRSPLVRQLVVELNDEPIARVRCSLDGHVVQVRDFQHEHRVLTEVWEELQKDGLAQGIREIYEAEAHGFVQAPETATQEDEMIRRSPTATAWDVSPAPDALPRLEGMLELWPAGWSRALASHVHGALSQKLGFDPPGATGQADPDEAISSDGVLRPRGLPVLSRIIGLLVLGPVLVLRDELRRLRYVGPLRDNPAREALGAREQHPTSWFAGSGAWDRLREGPLALVTESSRWLSSREGLDAGYELRRTTTRIVDPESASFAAALDRIDQGQDTMELRELLRQAPRRPQVHLVDLCRNIDVLTHDVGTGISQLIPVVVGLLDPETRMLAVEQPELHLHPAIQARLGDLLIECAQSGRGPLLIETHSEHLLLRLLRRIRETHEESSETPDRPLTPDQVSVVYVDLQDGKVSMSELRIDETGDFRDHWPRGFFLERLEEIY